MLSQDLEGQTAIVIPSHPAVISADLAPSLTGFSRWSSLGLITPITQVQIDFPQQGSSEQHNFVPERAPESLAGRITGPVRLIQAISNAWHLTTLELARLLAYPNEAMTKLLLDGLLTFDAKTDEDRGDRVRLMYNIHDTLAELFVSRQDEARWIRSPSVEFDMSPLTYMMENRIPGMITVREFVERRLANR